MVACLFACLFVCLLVCLFVYLLFVVCCLLFVCLLFVCLFVRSFICSFVCLFSISEPTAEENEQPDVQEASGDLASISEPTARQGLDKLEKGLIGVKQQVVAFGAHDPVFLEVKAKYAKVQGLLGEIHHVMTWKEFQCGSALTPKRAAEFVKYITCHSDQINESIEKTDAKNLQATQGQLFAQLPWLDHAFLLCLQLAW